MSMYRRVCGELQRVQLVLPTDSDPREAGRSEYGKVDGVE